MKILVMAAAAIACSLTAYAADQSPEVLAARQQMESILADKPVPTE